MPCPYNVRPAIRIRFSYVPAIGAWFATYYDDAVKVVGQDHKSVERYPWKVVGDRLPAVSNDTASRA
jgi:hypothetical protein